MELTPEEQRVLGCLLEKAATTPENYPLTMNALIGACNQTSNREPVVTYGEATVAAALLALREQKLTRIVYPAHARVTKYRHVLDEVWALTQPELAVIAVLLLRGAQTETELTARTERYGDLSDLGGVPGVLERLARRPEPLARLIGRRPGQREDRYIHLLGPLPPPIDLPTPRSAEISDRREESAPTPALSERILALEIETATLRGELSKLREWLEDALGESVPPSESAPD